MRPLRRRIHPRADALLHLALQQEEMRGVADFEIGGAGNLRARLLQICRIEQPPAIVTLVTARALKAAVRARAFHIAVRQEAAVVDGIDLLGRPLLDQPCRLETFAEVLRELAVRRIGGAAEMIERQPEAVARGLLDQVLLVAIGAHILSRFRRCQLRRRAVLIGRAQEQDLMALQAPEARMDVRRQHRAREIAEMLDAVDVGERGGDEKACHEGRDVGGRAPL
jgi:hypothetical protein